MRKPASVVAVIFLFVSTALLAQTGTTIRGRVTAASDGSGLPGVTVAIDELHLSTVTDAEGRYILNVPAANNGREVKLSAVLEGFQKRTADVRLYGDVTRDLTLRVAFGQEITVGSRAVGAEQEQAVPVDVISREQIETTPSTETNQILQRLSPSFNFPRPSISDGTDSVRPATLRGLGPDQLLVMVNGKRRHASALVNANNTIGRGSSGVDMNAIPASAIESIEILRDGAAAQYGSDAIAGVINVVMKSGKEPLKLDVKGGSTTHGDGQMLNTALSGGWNIGRGALFVAGEHRTRYETNRANPDIRDQRVTGDAGHNDIAQPNTHYGDSYARDVMLFANFDLPLTDDSKQIFYAFGGVSNRHGSHGGNFRRPIQTDVWLELYPDGFLPLIQPRVVDQSLVAGARGEMASWFYDLSGGYARNTFRFDVTDSENASLGPTSQTKFYAGQLGDDQTTLNFDLSRGFGVGMAGPLNVAVGAEFRRDGFQEKAGEVASYIDGGHPNRVGGKATPGAQVFPGYQPSNAVDASRNSKAVYVDLEGDVLSKLRLGVAGRFEDYSDFGNTTNGKITARYSPMKSLLFRAAASNGFRAPSLNQGFWSAISTNFIVNPATGNVEPFLVGTYRVDSPVAKALGAQPLKPEKSTNYSAGTVIQPLDNLEFTADFFHIDVDDRIVYTGNFNQAALQPLINPFGATAARFLTNAINTRTNGYDLVANYQPRLFGTRLDLSAAYSNNKTKIVGEVATPPQLAGLGAVLFDNQERRRFECGQPKDNVRLMQNWNQRGVNVTLRESRYGEFCSLTVLPVDDQTYSARWLEDAEISYNWNRYTFAVGAENLFDQYPDRNRFYRPGTTTFTAQINNSVNAYPINTPFGMNGRFVYSRVSLRY
ncbi:MAG: TonB-dependent receptor [Thermoanaerobaculia bacterium]